MFGHKVDHDYVVTVRCLMMVRDWPVPSTRTLTLTLDLLTRWITIGLYLTMLIEMK